MQSPHTFYPILLPPLDTNNFLSFFDSWAQKKGGHNCSWRGPQFKQLSKVAKYFLSELVSPILIILHLNKEQEKNLAPAGMKKKWLYIIEKMPLSHKMSSNPSRISEESLGAIRKACLTCRKLWMVTTFPLQQGLQGGCQGRKSPLLRS